MRARSAATSGEAPEVSDSMTSLSRVPSLSAHRALNHGSSDHFDPTMIRSPRKKKKDKYSFEDILSGRIEPFSPSQIPLTTIPPIYQKQIKAIQPGGQIQTAIEIDDDEEDDPISDPSSPQGSDHVAGWLSSPDRGLSRDPPTVALRKARTVQSPAASFKQLQFESTAREQSISSSVVAVSGDRRSSKRPTAAVDSASPDPHPPRTPPPTSSASQSPLTPNNLLSTPIDFEAFEWDATQTPSKAEATGTGPLAAASPIEAWKQQVAAESSSSKTSSSTRVLRSESGDSDIQVVGPHTGAKRGRDQMERVKPQPKKRKPIETEAFPLDLPDQPISDRQKQRDMANDLLSSQAKALLNTHDESQEVEEVSLEEFHAVIASQPQMALEGQDASNYCNAFIDRTKKCMFCLESLPKDPSPYFLNLSSTFASRQRGCRRQGKSIPWQESIDYCKRHRAEIKTFPLGLQAGYPPTMDFSKVVARVLSDEMSKQLIPLVIDSPCSSATFRTCSEEISAAPNPRKWSSDQSSAKIIRKIPGYLGELGRRAIAMAMNKWTHNGNLLPPEDKIRPMNRDDWCQYVMVPEIGRLLIHADIYGSLSKHNHETLEHAWRVLEQSREYGLMRFGPDSDFDTTDPESEAAESLQQPTVAHIDLSHDN